MNERTTMSVLLRYRVTVQAQKRVDFKIRFEKRTAGCLRSRLASFPARKGKGRLTAAQIRQSQHATAQREWCNTVQGYCTGSRILSASLAKMSYPVQYIHYAASYSSNNVKGGGSEPPIHSEYRSNAFMEDPDPDFSSRRTSLSFETVTPEPIPPSLSQRHTHSAAFPV